MEIGEWIAIIGLFITLGGIVLKINGTLVRIDTKLERDESDNRGRDRRIEDLEEHDSEQDIILADHGARLTNLESNHNRIHQFDGVNGKG